MDGPFHSVLKLTDVAFKKEDGNAVITNFEVVKDDLTEEWKLSAEAGAARSLARSLAPFLFIRLEQFLKPPRHVCSGPLTTDVLTCMHRVTSTPTLSLRIERTAFNAQVSGRLTSTLCAGYTMNKQSRLNARVS